jgi:hypothetical protein
MLEAESRCSKCNAVVTVGERFCAACGAAVGLDPPAHANAPSVQGSGMQDPLPPPVDLVAARKMTVARKWLFAVSILTLVFGLVFYAMNKSEVDNQIRDAERALAGLDPAERDARLMASPVHMTWDEIVRHDRGMVNQLLAVNIGLAIAFMGLWFWAKRNVLAACVVALLLFITVTLVNVAIEPSTLYKGILLKILFIAALAKAISAAQQERRLAA